MSIIICPRCQMRVTTSPHSVDVEHQCNSGNKTLDNEDIAIIGNWKDYSGSGTELNPLTRGMENKVFGTRAQLEGEDVESVTKRGHRATTMRQRPHIEFIQLGVNNE